MTLEKYIKDIKKGKCPQEVKNIRESFIKSGYEKFLYIDSIGAFEARKKTDLLIEIKKQEIVEKPQIRSFIKQFDGCFLNSVGFIYPEKYDPNYYIIDEIVRNVGGKRYIVKNIFQEEETINVLALIPANRIEEISLLHHIVYSGVLGENFGGYKLFGTDISFYTTFCTGDGIIYSLNYLGNEDLFHFQGFETRRDTNPYKIFKVRKTIEMLINEGYFETEFDLYYNLVEYLMPFLQSMYNTTKSISANASFDWKAKRTEIRSKLVKDGIIQSKWKNEESLFKLVIEFFPDALYQYRPKWLSPQSLDIFIPSLDIAIEYQGIQHFESVDFFGGEDGLTRRVALDKKKRRLCVENNVRLIEWDYFMEITPANLKRQIQKVI